MTEGELILYTAEDGSVAIQLRAEGGTVWITQAEMAALFHTTPQNITLHVKAIYVEGELLPEATCKEHLQVRQEAARQVKRTLKHYNLDMILAVGYRVRSLRGIQFRQWASSTLKEYLVKGFAMDDERLKQAQHWDYFDEWLARIRDIRASEKRFYQKLKDLFTTAVDYDKTTEQAQLFFKQAQNKMLWAVTGHTAAELIAARADASQPNMGLTSWRGNRVRQGDVSIAKNYLQQPEIVALNRIVVMYLDHADDMAQRRQTMTMQDWAQKLDTFLAFNERDVLTHAGKLRADVAEKLALKRYEAFDAARREAARLAADAEDVAALEQIERELESRSRGKKK